MQLVSHRVQHRLAVFPCSVVQERASGDMHPYVTTGGDVSMENDVSGGGGGGGFKTEHGRSFTKKKL